MTGGGNTGGCQCGAVRYRLMAQPSDAHICHCRMCQKAVGGPFAALAVVNPDDIEWTRGKPAVFNSSENVQRGFCAKCGTPLTYHYLGNDRLNFSIASLDAPGQVVPDIQIGIESRLPWCAALANLPERTTDDIMPEDKKTNMGKNRQHADHD